VLSAYLIRLCEGLLFSLLAHLRWSALGRQHLTSAQYTFINVRILASLRLDVRQCWCRVRALLISPGSLFSLADFPGWSGVACVLGLLRALLQLRVLSFDLLEDRDVGVGVPLCGSGVFVGLRKENGAERSQAARPRLPATRSSSSNSMCFPSANSISFLAASKLGA
jgi:hypothetical protein